MKLQNKTMKHISKPSIFVHREKKNKILKQFHQNKFSTVLIKTIFYLKRGNTRREFIGINLESRQFDKHYITIYR